MQVPSTINEYGNYLLKRIKPVSNTGKDPDSNYMNEPVGG